MVLIYKVRTPVVHVSGTPFLVLQRRNLYQTFSPSGSHRIDSVEGDVTDVFRPGDFLKWDLDTPWSLSSARSSNYCRVALATVLLPYMPRYPWVLP